MGTAVRDSLGQRKQGAHQGIKLEDVGLGHQDYTPGQVCSTGLRSSGLRPSWSTWIVTVVPLVGGSLI